MKNKKIIFTVSISIIVLSILVIGSVVVIKRPNHNNNMKDYLEMQIKLNEDYEYFWEYLDKNFVLWGVLERAGFNRGEVYKKYKAEIVDCENYVDFAHLVMFPISKQFRDYGLGHTNLLNADMYKTQLAAYSREYDFSIFSDEYTNAAKKIVSSTYELLKSSTIYDKYGDLLTDFNTLKSKEKVDVVQTKIYKQNEIAYIDLNSMWYNDNEKQELTDFLKSITDYEDLIIDIRGNGGGNDSYWFPISDYLSSHDLTYTSRSLYNTNSGNEEHMSYVKEYKIIKNIPNDYDFGEAFVKDDLKYFDSYTINENTYSFNPELYTGFDGNIYLLIDNGTFSSADSCAGTFKKCGFATLIGETTGGGGMGGEILFFMLPNSQLIWSYVASVGLNDDGSNNEETGVIPDIIISADIDGLDYCLNLIEEK